MATMYRQIEKDLRCGKIEPWAEMLASIMEENRFYHSGFEEGCWLTRARKMKKGKTENEPYIGSAIGMNLPKNKDRTSTDNRWGEMCYLSTDMSHQSTFAEKGKKKEEKGTVGYFFVTEKLELFNATGPFAMADTNGVYGDLRAGDALLIMVALINNWFNASAEENNSAVYQVTNSIGRIIRDYTNLDGIVYRCDKNKNKTWNVALKDESKICWSYSVLFVPDKLGSYSKNSIITGESYHEHQQYTSEFLRFIEPDYYPPQMKSIFQHSFPEYLPEETKP